MSSGQSTPFDLLPDSIQVALIVTGELERLGITYLIGGSVASIVHGIPRLTQDVDLVADIREEHVPDLISALEADFYIDEQAVRRAVRARASFNLIYLEKMHKVDVFIPKGDSWSQDLKVQSGAINYDYLRRWATELRITDLLHKALDDAGFTGSSLA